MSEGGELFVVGLENVILEQAREAARLATMASTPREAGGKSIAAITLAVAAIEAQLGTWAAIFREDYSIDAATLQRWRTRGPQDITKDILSRLDPPVQTGNLDWYRALCAIVEIRNHAAHYFPEFRQPGTWPPRIRPYVANGTITPVGDDTMDWTSRLFVGSVANQCVEHARKVMCEFQATAWRAA